MRKYLIIFILIATQSFGQNSMNALDILEKLDNNMTSDTKILTSEMKVYGKRNTRTIRSKSYSIGALKSFSEYLSPAKEKGTKMLKLENRLWIYSPSSDRTIQISGHMLRQSVMGSDLSYEDMMEDRKLTEMYEAKIIGEESIEGTLVWILELKAKLEDVSYFKRKLWINKDLFTPLKEELYAKSGELLKQISYSDTKQINQKWYPMRINYKDMLKTGKGTDFIILEIEFNAEIPKHVFSKASLRR